MDPHVVDLTFKIVLGNGVLTQIPKICDELKLKGPAIVFTGPSTKRVAGNQVRDYLEDHGYSVEKRIIREGNSEEARQSLENSEGFQFILGVGGGKVIDMAKYVSFKKKIPFLSVPTAPSHDGIASARAVINGEEGRKYSYQSVPPLAIIADIVVISQAPYRLIAAGCGDTIANITAVEDWKLASALSLLAAKIVMHSSKMIRNKEERGIRNLMEALISSGVAMNIAGSSRPCSGAEHSFSHYLDANGSKALHGEQCGLGTIFFSYLHELNWIEIKGKLKEIGAPTTAEELGLDKELIIKAFSNCHKIRDRYTILKDGISEDKAKEVCKETGII
jgi:glycerol-1-phosphate dehydrogenase [NAD(P)+]